ncbi:MAG: tetrahydrofolate dehydrogenase/cyclohydrolase catalytic domain-containing protein, partial [Gordonibacter urolithinfaciens]
MATLLTGKPVVDRLAQELAPRIEALGLAGIVPALAIVRMGERPDDLSYERTAQKRAESLGIAVRSFVLPEDAPQEVLEAALADVNADASIHGCLLFRPLPV